VAKRKGMDSYVEKDGLLCGEGWVDKLRGMGGLKRDGWLSGEGWVAKRRGMGG
jgi:hypothetical protein